MPCCGKIKKPHVNRELLPVKAQQFFYYGGVHSMFTYVSLHLRLAGLSIADITIISSFIPIAGILGAPLIGLCTDVFGRYKLMAGIVLCTTAALFSSLLLIPTYGQENRTLNAQVSCYERVNLLYVDKCDQVDACSPNVTALAFLDCGPLTSNQSEAEIKPDSCASGDFCAEFNNSNSDATAAILFYEQQESTCVYRMDNNNALNASYTKFCPTICQYKTSDCQSTIGRWEETFYPFFVLRLLAQFCLFSCYSMVDTTTIGALKKHGGKYGQHRVFSHLAQALFPFMSGAIMDAASGGTGKSVIWPAYVLFDACLVIVILLLLPMTLKQEKIPGSTWEAVKKLATNKRCFVLFILAMLGGIVPGFLGVFLTIYLKSLNSPMTLIGLVSTSGALTSIFLMFFSDWIVVRMGYLNVLCTGFLLNALNVFCLSIIQVPWWAVLLGTTRAFTQNVCWVALIKWNGVVAPKELLGTTLGTIRAFTYGLGRTIGVVCGGALMVQLGDRRTFQIFGAFYAFLGIGWLLVYHIFLKKCMENIPEEEKTLEKGSPVEPMTYSNPVMEGKFSSNPEECELMDLKEKEIKDLKLSIEIPTQNGTIMAEIKENS